MLLIMSYWAKLFMMKGKLQRAHPTLRGHFAPVYLVGSNKLRAYLFLIYVIKILEFPVFYTTQISLYSMILLTPFLYLWLGPNKTMLIMLKITQDSRMKIFAIFHISLIVVWKYVHSFTIILCVGETLTSSR